MTPERWQQIEPILSDALNCEADQRAAFLEQACGTDASLRAEILSLLKYHNQAEQTPTQPAVNIVAQALVEEAEQPPVPPVFENYELISSLGKGGMGEVWLARDRRLKRKVALKILPAAFTKEPERMRRFEQEARTASALNHPNILTVYEIGETNGAYFIATEYVEGQTLRQHLKQGALPINEAIALTLQIANALKAAHTAGIVHRDIKPENIMLRPDGYVKVLDFGIAKLLEKDEGGGMRDESERGIQLHPSSLIPHPYTTPGQIIGTAAYLSPEQARGYAVDERSDIFSLGVLFYELLTGRLPFAGATVSDLIAAILLSEPISLSRCLSDLPSDLEPILKRMLRKEREQRYQTIGAFTAELKSLQEEMEFAARLQRRAEPPVANRSAEAETRRLTPQHMPTAAGERPANLSVPPTPLIGREHERAAIQQLVQQDSIRLLTLTGAGGTGKTRLGLQIAADLQTSFADGVAFVPLASINDPGLVPSAITQALGLKENAITSLHTSLKEFLRHKQMLLLIDNFEQVVTAAPTITELLAACPQIKILITSRAALKVRWEHEFPVPPLSLPAAQDSLATLAQTPAVALFLERTRAVKPDFELTEENAQFIAEICARLDGLPLALELAAARLRALTPRALLQRLDQRLKLLSGGARDLPERQQTIRNTIKWSYDLLNEEEQMLFRRLAVFVGGFTLEAAEAVCQNEVRLDVLDGVASLVDKSLLQQKEQADGEPRFSMLLTIKEYGLELLAESGELAAAEQAHTNYFLALAEKAEPQLTGANPKRWLDQLEQEHDNLRAVFERALQQGQADEGLRLAGAIWRFWSLRSHFREGRERLATLLKATESIGPTALRAKVLTGAATLEQNQGDYEVARILFEEVLHIRRTLNDKPGIAAALTSLGWVGWRQNEYETAWTLSEEAAVLYQELGNQPGVIQARNTLAWVAHHRGDFEQARALHEECIQFRRKSGDKHRHAFSLGMLGWTLQKLGQVEEAVRLVDESLTIMQELGDRQMVAWLSGHRGNLALDQGDRALAESLSEVSREIFTEIGDRYGLAHPLTLLAELRLLEGDAATAKRHLAESLKLRLAIRDRYGIANSLERLAWVAEHKQQWEHAARLLSAAEALRALIGVRLGMTDEPRFTQHKQAVLTALGPERFAVCWQTGKTLNAEAVLSKIEEGHR